MVGTTGARPCICVIVVGPKDAAGKRIIWVYHFNPGDNPRATFKRDKFPKGSHAVIAGGDDNDPASTSTLYDVLASLVLAEAIIDGVYNSPGIWVDSKGKYYVYEVERIQANMDGTKPLPQKDWELWDLEKGKPRDK
jgi:hypothetical protein